MKLLSFLLSFMMAFTASVSAIAQERIGTYTFCGMEKSVAFNQETQFVAIDAHDTGVHQTIALKGKESIEGFMKSLTATKEEYIALKASVNAEGKTKMTTSFEKFAVGWTLPAGKNNALMGVCDNLHPVFQVTRNKKTKELESFAVIDDRVKDITAGNGNAVLFICFQNENEIQSLIDVLGLCVERLSTPSSSQSPAPSFSQSLTAIDSQEPTEDNFWPSSKATIFDYTTIKNVSLKGIISPTEIDKYHILLIHCGRSYVDGNYYLAIPTERICNIWISSLNNMKELFIKNDQIAKDNDVISDISKFVSEKFNFEGFLVSTWNKNVYTINGGRWPASIGVEYRYIKGKSSMVLYMKDANDAKWNSIFVFNSVQEFDDAINALTWSNFMQAFNAQAQKFKEQEELEERKKREQSLFD